ncbi:hypothetical protein DOTSEDRAFT_74184 [Dothistroma septosporum NZE10]|uniref:Uncharacterized protein n=1 Tax=Dothistroma septosporum (strain NZE10 / CBS 128990) TaxID=675120 RepID=N1PEJ2_DOTSN|nr:hypothetical protein DOTSEDRAFT_74184 [Dothistroma septosporum NZE10]
MVSIRALLVSLSALSSGLAMPFDLGEQDPGLKHHSEDRGNPTKQWLESLEIQLGGAFHTIRQRCIEKSVQNFKFEYNPFEASNDREIVACNRFASQAMFDVFTMKEDQLEQLFKKVNPKAENPLGHHHDARDEDDLLLSVAHDDDSMADETGGDPTTQAEDGPTTQAEDGPTTQAEDESTTRAENDLLSERSTKDDDARRKAKYQAKKECKQNTEELYDCKSLDNKLDLKMCEMHKKADFEECSIQVDQKYDHLHRRQLFPGGSAVDEEVLKDVGKAAVWFAENCATELILAKLEGRRPHYAGLKEKFMCPAIAMTFPQLSPQWPFEALTMPGPVIEEKQGVSMPV